MVWEKVKECMVKSVTGTMYILPTYSVFYCFHIACVIVWKDKHWTNSGLWPGKNERRRALIALAQNYGSLYAPTDSVSNKKGERNAHCLEGNKCRFMCITIEISGLIHLHFTFWTVAGLQKAVKRQGVIWSYHTPSINSKVLNVNIADFLKRKDQCVTDFTCNMLKHAFWVKVTWQPQFL